jgi:hypothetical protein
MIVLSAAIDPPPDACNRCGENPPPDMPLSSDRKYWARCPHIVGQVADRAESELFAKITTDLTEARGNMERIEGKVAIITGAGRGADERSHGDSLRKAPRSRRCS